MTLDRTRLISTHSAARRLGCSPSTIRRWVDEGILPAVQPGPHKHFRIPLAAVEQLQQPTTR